MVAALASLQEVNAQQGTWKLVGEKLGEKLGLLMRC